MKLQFKSWREPSRKKARKGNNNCPTVVITKKVPLTYAQIVERRRNQKLAAKLCRKNSFHPGKPKPKGKHEHKHSPPA